MVNRKKGASRPQVLLGVFRIIQINFEGMLNQSVFQQQLEKESYTKYNKKMRICVNFGLTNAEGKKML